MFDAQTKIVALDELSGWREGLRERGKSLVVTNGCFDLLHAGHIRYLESARNLGDALLVGLNGDESVRALKGSGRPINGASDRALVLSALGCVDAVCEFPERRADRFLNIARPDQYVKGGDYTLETLDPNERSAVEQHGGQIIILSFVPGKSTTATIQKISSEGGLKLPGI
ncbi:MAG: D-beta-D-heptose 1-phosphate adenylyltransferase [Verrucomicrobia subdivision 3 bacterium]|nr:D-beta-D-heptose 1-phosphate adenylyltransferase [Limisphaerales bacterium]MCS1414670.1 D-beta-D-heptose 1-phosphate adenylyltransferase [Limisphaerales bacterium]